MTLTASPDMHAYFDGLVSHVHAAYDVAKAARARGLDPSRDVEIPPAGDMAARVEGLVGPKGIGDVIRAHLAAGLEREAVCFKITEDIATGKIDVPVPPNMDAREVRLEQSIRTGLALFTDGVVSAPIEGVSKVKIKRNQDGTEFLAVYFAGPIRGAGGTGQAFTLIIADYARQKIGLPGFRPSDAEVDRVVEESNLYAIRTRAGQYVPTEDELRHIMKSMAVSCDGDATEDYEVSHKNTYNVETNRVRGGMCLVLSEGLCLKAAKIMKITKKAGMDWAWIEKLIKTSKQAGAGKMEIKPNDKYIHEIVAGRPILAYPMRAGGFRLRYGRTPYTGIASKAIHPATMAALGHFIVTGTQMKIERPGKGCIATASLDVDGPIVKMRDGSVVQFNEHAQAERLKGEMAEIIFLGDLLVNHGDFQKANHPLVPGAWCDEWYQLELKEAGVEKSRDEIRAMTVEEAVQLAQEKNVPLAPAFTFYYADLSPAQLKTLVEWLGLSGKQQPNGEWHVPFHFVAPAEGTAIEMTGKRVLELLGVLHSVQNPPANATDAASTPAQTTQTGQSFDRMAVLTAQTALALKETLDLTVASDGRIDTLSFLDAWDKTYGAKGTEIVVNAPTVLEFLSSRAGFTVKNKAGTYIGASMGRPEKAKERRMKPPVHSLFPIGAAGGKSRDITKAVSMMKAKMEKLLEVEVQIRVCPQCQTRTGLTLCPNCAATTQAKRKCEKCGKLNDVHALKCPCGGRLHEYEKIKVPLTTEYERAKTRVHADPDQVKGVIGLISASKVPEALEKGILRSKYGAYVFRDGTCRFDATEIPATHFTPREITTSIPKLIELGYTKDVKGEPLTRPDQTLELKPQDVFLAKYAANYFLQVANFVDDLLVYHYGLQPHYNAKNGDDLLGKEMICIAPHISAGIIGRLIGYCDARGIVMHPYMHCAIRRNTDGDEGTAMLLMDALLNFSKEFLPQTRGGKMDAPLVLTLTLEPSEVDDEVHAMDAAWQYPLEFYRAAERLASPSEIKKESMSSISSRLGKPSQYEGIGFTHSGTLLAPFATAYTELGNMAEKLEVELELMERIRAVDAGGAAERILISHFLPDIMGNLRKFSKQEMRCVACGQHYRRAPLAGKCRRCAGKLILTIHKGNVLKYLKVAQGMAERFHLANYIKQRLMLLEREVKSVFEDEKKKQVSLSDFL